MVLIDRRKEPFFIHSHACGTASKGSLVRGRGLLHKGQARLQTRPGEGREKLDIPPEGCRIVGYQFFGP